MPPPATQKRKRQRKRKRRNDISSSSSSGSDLDSDAGSSTNQGTQKKVPVTIQKSVEPESKSDDSDSASDSSVASSSSEDVHLNSVVESKRSNDIEMAEVHPPEPTPARRDSRSPSPSPPKLVLPSFLPEDVDYPEEQAAQQQLKEKFRKFWMERMAAGFKGDLEHIRKEPSMDMARITLLIDSLASGAESMSSEEARLAVMEDS